MIILLPVAQPGAFDLVGYVIYDVEGKAYQNVFYNGTIEVVESGGLLSGESVFLITLGIALLLLLGLWAYSQVQRLTKVFIPISCFEHFKLCVFYSPYFVKFYLTISLFYQKTKKVSKVEVGTRSVDASLDEWLEVSNSLSLSLSYL